MSYEWNEGDEITADRLNQMNPATQDAIEQIDHNVLMLYLENYFASKATPFNGLFFDGFSDSAKVGTNTNLTVNTGSKRVDMAGSNLTGSLLSIKSSFQELKTRVKLWITRKCDTRYTLQAGISAGATAVRYSGASNLFAIGDLIDIYTANNLSRERKTITGVNVISSVGTVAVDTSTSHSGSGTSLTKSMTIAANSNRVLVVHVGTYSSQQVPSGVTWNGVALTLAGSVQGGNDNSVRSSIWYLVNPAAGTYNLVVSVGSSCSINLGATSFYNAGGVSGFTSNSASYSGSPYALTMSVSGVTANDAAFTGGACNSGVSYGAAAGSSTTLVQNTGPNGSWYRLGSGTVNTQAGNAWSVGWCGVVVTGTAPVSELTWSGGLASAYTTSDYVERVDITPQVSLVASGAGDSLAGMTYVKSVYDSANTEVEDEYEYSNAGGYDFKAKLLFSRNQTSQAPYAKRLGCALYEE